MGIGSNLDIGMNIYATPGSKVVFAFPKNGYSHHQEIAKQLKVGETYTVKETRVYAWHTDVFLEEVPGIPFNSVLFKDAES